MMRTPKTPRKRMPGMRKMNSDDDGDSLSPSWIYGGGYYMAMR